MPQVVNVKGVGRVRFPDGVSQQDMAAALQKNFSPTGKLRSEVKHQQQQRMAELRQQGENISRFNPVDPDEPAKAPGGYRIQAGIGVAKGLADLSATGNRLLQLGLGWTHPAVKEQFQGAAQVARKMSGQLEQLGEDTEGPGLVRDVGAGMMSTVPSLTAAPLGFPAMAATAGLQSFGGSLADYEEQIFNRNPVKGMEAATKEALVPALATGVATSLITAAFGRTGVEAVSGVGRAGVTPDAVQAAVQSVRGFAKSVGLEATEEWADELVGGVIEKVAVNPDLDPMDIAQRAAKAGLIGGIAAGAVDLALTADRIEARRRRELDEARVNLGTALDAFDEDPEVLPGDARALPAPRVPSRLPGVSQPRRIADGRGPILLPEEGQENLKPSTYDFGPIELRDDWGSDIKPYDNSRWQGVSRSGDPAYGVDQVQQREARYDFEGVDGEVPLVPARGAQGEPEYDLTGVKGIDTLEAPQEGSGEPSYDFDGLERIEDLGQRVEAARGLLRDAYYDLGQIGIVSDPKDRARRYYRFYRALRSAGEAYWQMGVKSLEEFASKVGFGINNFVRAAWDDAVKGVQRPLEELPMLNVEVDEPQEGEKVTPGRQAKIDQQRQERRGTEKLFVNKERLEDIQVDQAVIDSLRPLNEASGVDGPGNLRSRKNMREGTGVAKNRSRVFRTQDGKPIYIGAIAKDGGKPFDGWIEETETWLSDQEIATFRSWYRELKSEFIKEFGEDEAPKMMTAWLAAQQNVSPTGALQNVFRVEDRLGGIGVGKKGGLADEKIEGVLTGDMPEKGFAAKLSDFVDAGYLREFRTYMGEEPTGGRPFVADVHTGRDSGHVDQQTLTRLKEMADGGDLFLDGKPVQIEVTQAKTTKKKVTDKKTGEITYKYSEEPKQVRVKVGRMKPFLVDADMIGSPSGGKYEGISLWGNRLTDVLNDRKWKGGNWNPAEVQAVGWMRTLRQYGLAEGSVDSALRDNTVKVMAEVDFGSGAVLPQRFGDFGSLPYEARRAITTEVLTRASRELVGLIGGSLRLRAIEEVDGVWAGNRAPSMAISLLGSVEAAHAFEAALAYASEQAATMSIIAGLGGKNSRALTVSKQDGSEFTMDEVSSIMEAAGVGGATVQKKPGENTIFIAGSTPDYRPKSMTEKAVEKAQKAVESWGDRNGVNLITDTPTVTIGSYVTDWKAAEGGESYQAEFNRTAESRTVRLNDFRRRYAEILHEAYERQASGQAPDLNFLRPPKRVQSKEDAALREAHEELYRAWRSFSRFDLGIVHDPEKEARKLYALYKALRRLAKVYISRGVKTLEAFAKEIGMKVDRMVRRAWEETKAGKPEVSFDEFQSDTDLIEESAKQYQQRKFSRRFDQDERIHKDIRNKTGNREYGPIPNVLTASQAYQIVEERGLEGARADLMNENLGLPERVRVMLGQAILQKANQAYVRETDAGKKQALLDFSVETAEWLTEYGTRLGQGVQAFAAWTRLSPEGYVAMYAKAVRKAQAAWDAEEAAGASVLKRAKDLFKHAKDRPEMDKAESRKILEAARKALAKPEGFQRQEAVIDVLARISRAKGVSKADLLVALWYANVLSGWTTQVLNASSTLAVLLAETSVYAARHPAMVPELLIGLYQGFGRGIHDSAAVLKTGKVTGTRSRKTEAPRALEMHRFKGPFSFLNAWKYVGRVMGATDMVYFRSAEEMVARVVANRVAKEEGLTGPALSKRVAEILHERPEDRVAAIKQATDEGLSGNDFKRRVAEIRQQAWPENLVAEAAEAGFRNTFNQDPVGVLGMLAYRIGGMVSEFGPLRLLIPFTQIVANVSNVGLDYSPWGYKRLFVGHWTKSHGTPPPEGEEWGQQLGRATLGTLGMTAIAALALRYLGDDDPPFAVSALGPSDGAKRAMLMETGWMPYSVKIGDTYYSYKAVPFAVGLSIVGEYLDAIKYRKLGEKDLATRLAYAVWTSKRMLLEQSFLSGLSDFFQGLDRSTVGRPDNVFRGLSRTVQSVLVPNLVAQVARAFDPTVYDSDTLAQAMIRDLPVANGMLPARYNVLGETVQRARNPFWHAENKDALWSWMSKTQAWPSMPSKTTMLGDRTMEPAEYRKYVRESGKRLKEELLVDLPYLQTMEAKEARREVARRASRIRREVKQEMLDSVGF